IDGPRRIDVKAAGHAQQAGSIGFDPGWKWNGGWHGWQMGVGTESKNRWPGHRPRATAKMRQTLQPKAGRAELPPAAAKAANSPNLDRRAAPPVSPSDVLLSRPAGALAFACWSRHRGSRKDLQITGTLPLGDTTEVGVVFLDQRLQVVGV